MNPLVFVPWQPSLPNVDLVMPNFLAIAATGVSWLHLPAMPADKALNTAGKELLKLDHTHLISLDWDHVHPADIVQRFVVSLTAHPEIQILGGLNYMRSEPYEPCVWIKKDGKYYRPHKWQPGIIEVEYVGFGCIAIAREVFEKIDYPWFVNDHSEGGWLQDINFCKKAREAGIRVWCDYELTSPHVGVKLIDENTYREHYDKQF